MTSIIIVTYNSERTVGTLLESIKKNVKEGSYEVIVVDNHSTDGTINLVKTQPHITLVEEPTNTGFAAACHRGVEKSTGGYLLFLNPDTCFIEDSITPLIPMFSDDRVGVVGVRQKNEDGTHQPSARRFPTITSQLLIFFKLHRLFPNLPSLKWYFYYDFDYEAESEVDQVMGAFFFTTKKLWDALGGFDRRFFIWYEEVDYCFQAKQRGYKTLYTPRTTIIHVSGHSFSQVARPIRMFWFARSMVQYTFKNIL